MPKTHGKNLRAVSDGPANDTSTDVSRANPNGVVFSDTGSNRLNRIESATDASSSHSERAPRKGRLTQIAKPHITSGVICLKKPGGAVRWICATVCSAVAASKSALRNR